MIMSFIDRPIKDIHSMFTQINHDCRESGQGVVCLTDVDYYSNQIFNLNNERDFDKCVNIAQQLAAYEFDNQS